MPKSFRGFIEDVNDEVLEVEKEVRPDEFEASAILEHLEERGEFPLVHFTNPTGIGGRDTEPGTVTLASNVFADRKRLARSFGLDRSEYRMELVKRYAELEEQLTEPTVVEADDAPVKEVSQVEEYGEVDVRRLPMMHINEMDPDCYFDMANVMRGPPEDVEEFGGEFYNCAFLRTQYKGPDKLGIHMSPRHNYRIVMRNWEHDRPTPVAIVLGHHPTFYFGSLTLANYGADEYDIIGGTMNEPLRLTASETWGDDFLVPADAEIVLEGEIPPNVREPEAPFGEYPGYYGPQRMRPVINVTNVTRRKHSILQTVFTGHRDHWLAGTLSKEGGLYHSLKHEGRISGLQQVHQPPSGTGRFSAYLSIEKFAEGEGKQAAMAALAAGDQTLKHVYVVDDDVDVFNEEEVLWAVATRCRVDEDIDIIKGAKGNTLDPTVKPGYDVKNSKMIVDATVPLEYPYPSRVQVPDDVKADIDEEWDAFVDEEQLKQYRNL